MSFVSPILNNYINNRGVKPNKNTANYNDAYEELTNRANDVKPNKAKARIVENDPLTYIGNPIRDNFRDVKNMKKAVSDGKISDNNLGRLNDLGLKGGALLIAAFLALHSDTKTKAIMNFIGGATFVASMSLWTKAFINLPARLIHGFPIGQKYISAQGDKKDFYLDNQFIVWDAMKEEDKRKYAKRAGIDYDEEGGKEKIERKMQKTALQNRTLNLLTVGLGAPLMTALFCNRLEPLIAKNVTKSQYKQTKQAVNNGLEATLNSVKPDVRNEKAIQKLFNKNQKALYEDDEFFKSLAGLLDIGDIRSDFKNPDWAKVIEGFNTYNLDAELKELYNQKAKVNVDSFTQILADKEIANVVEDFDAQLLGILDGKSEASAVSQFGADNAQRFIKALNGDFTINNIKKVAQSAEFKEFDINDNFLKEAINKAGVDNSEFKNAIEEFNSTTVATLRAKLKAYVQHVNHVMGSDAESVYTENILTNIKKAMNNLLLPYKSKDGSVSLQKIKEGSVDECIDMLSSLYSKEAEQGLNGAQSFQELIKKYAPIAFNDETKEVASKLADSSNISLINAETKEGFEGLTNAILGGKDTQANLYHLISNFIQNKNIDNAYLAAKPLIALNFEARVKDGSFEKAIKEVMAEGDSIEEYMSIARKLVYDGGSSYRNNKGYTVNNDICDKLINIIYDKNAFAAEESQIKGFGDIVEGIKAYEGTLSQKFFKTGSFTEVFQAQARRTFNDKHWARIFVPMAIILTAFTLLIQPFFGKIDKEFAKKQNEGSAK